MKHFWLLLPACLFSLSIASAQRGDIIVPTGAEISVPAGAQICADRIFANNPGYGTLTIANASCLCAGMAIVPVELLALGAVYEHGTVAVAWRSAAERNCAGFEVQRGTRAGGSRSAS
jgi:hypothetical protein